MTKPQASKALVQDLMRLRKQTSKLQKRKRTSGGLVFCLTVVILGLNSRVQAVGYRLPNQSPNPIARGNAFVATADEPSAVYYNPAGITQLGNNQVQAGIYAVNANIDYDSPSGDSFHNDATFQPVPQLYYVYSPDKLPLAFGLGVYFPYGLALKWPEDSSFRTLAIEGQLSYATINPVVAWQIHPTLSVGIGPTLNYAQVDFKRGIGLAPNDKFSFDGDGFDAGFNAGIRWQPHPQWAFGAKYHSATTIDFRGDSKAVPFAGATSTSAAFPFPQFAVFGVSFRPNEKWNFEANFDWTDWDNVNEINFQGTFGGDQVFPLQYQSSWMYEFGATRYFANGYHVSAGYFYSENSVPNRTYNPIVPDNDLHLGSAGFGRKGKRWEWSLAYHFALGPTRTVKGNISPLANGQYSFFNQAFTASLLFKF